MEERLETNDRKLGYHEMLRDVIGKVEHCLCKLRQGEMGLFSIGRKAMYMLQRCDSEIGKESRCPSMFPD